MLNPASYSNANFQTPSISIQFKAETRLVAYQTGPDFFKFLAENFLKYFPALFFAEHFIAKEKQPSHENVSCQIFSLMNCLSLPMAYLMAEPFEIPHARFCRHFHDAEDSAEPRFITYLNLYLRFSLRAITKHGFKFFPRNFVPVFQPAANFSKIFFQRSV